MTDTKLKVGYDQQAENTYNKDKATKNKALTEAFAYCLDFVPSLDIEAFKTNFKKVFIESFQEYYKGQFPAIVPIEKQIELSECSLYQIESFQLQYDKIKIDLTEEKDFNIYLTDANHIHRYQTLEKAIKGLDILTEIGIRYYPAQIQTALKNSVQYDFKDNTLKPNLHWCKGTLR